ncbi:hypothetical protein IFM89_038230 [Coptis chinensis]|uniref:Uncharacterized protein n=1 Tax=Coptis chinensis TaxID=261450 RepID=A0A835IGX5_9MAGN|nr:hypothetical protein IFM89_038230 [Coptis chinensis]
MYNFMNNCVPAQLQISKSIFRWATNRLHSLKSYKKQWINSAISSVSRIDNGVTLIRIELAKRLQCGYKSTCEEQVAEVLKLVHSLQHMKIANEVETLDSQLYEPPMSFLKIIFGSTIKGRNTNNVGLKQLLIPSQEKEYIDEQCSGEWLKRLDANVGAIKQMFKSLTGNDEEALKMINSGEYFVYLE